MLIASHPVDSPHYIPMPVLGVTGGIACGKTTFTDALSLYFPDATRFNADTEVEQLIARNVEVRTAIVQVLGEDSFLDDGSYNRALVRRRIFLNGDLRAKLNEILHPRVRERWLGLAKQHRSPQDWLFLEIPLLYETGGNVHCDRVITVGCTTEVQMHRLTVLRELPEEQAQQIRATQWSLHEKSNRADHLIWNDGPSPSLKRQAAICAAWLRSHYSRADSVSEPTGS